MRRPLPKPSSSLVNHSTHSVKPVNYAISLFDLEFGGAFGYQGAVTISSEIRKPTKEIVLNTHQLKIHEASVTTEHTKTQQSIKTTNVSYDEKNQRATLTFDQELPASSKADITIKFQGTINNASSPHENAVNASTNHDAVDGRLLPIKVQACCYSCSFRCQG